MTTQLAAMHKKIVKICHVGFSHLNHHQARQVQVYYSDNNFKAVSLKKIVFSCFFVELDDDERQMVMTYVSHPFCTHTHDIYTKEGIFLSCLTCANCISEGNGS